MSFHLLPSSVLPKSTSVCGSPTAFIWLALLLFFLIFWLWRTVVRYQRLKKAHKATRQQLQELQKDSKRKEATLNAEMAHYRSFIKPHFLFNILNAIANMCDKDNASANKLILELAEYLRAGLEFRQQSKNIFLKHELVFVDLYLRLEQARFGSKIEIKYDVDTSLYLEIPPLILQPLVENAIRHGIVKKPGGGTVTVRVVKAGTGAQLAVEDDGIGMAAEVWQAVLHSEGKSNAGNDLYCINNRLQKMYGQGLAITSREGQGTQVCFVIPDSAGPGGRIGRG